MGGSAKKEHLLTALHALGKALESKDKALRNVVILCFPGVVHSTYKHIYGGNACTHVLRGDCATQSDCLLTVSIDWQKAWYKAQEISLWTFGHGVPGDLQNSITGALGCFSVIGGKPLLLRTLHTYYIGLKWVLTWMFSSCVLAPMVLEYAMQADKGERKLIVLPRVTPLNHNNDQHGKISIKV